MPLTLTQQQQAQQWIQQQQTQKMLQQGIQQQQQGGGYFMPTPGAQNNGTIPTIQYPTTTGGSASGMPSDIMHMVDMAAAGIGLLMFGFVAIKVLKASTSKEGSFFDALGPVVVCGLIAFVWATYVRPMF